MEIVKEYSDDGKSGLNIKGRDSLAQMIRDVQEGKAHFSSILVYDVSRWGRFQDADESAYYEYICRQAGVAVHYCAEQFENDGSPVSTIIKSIKRTMAGEYSRELSTKVFQGACRLVKLGFRQGGTAGYGLRRVLMDQSGARKGELKMGEQKSIQTDRVVLVAGPDEEVEIVRWIYQAFITDGKIGIRDCRRTERARHRDGLRAGMEPGDGASSAHQRKIHRQQRLSPDFVQTEKEACQQSAGQMDSSERRFCRASSNRNYSCRRGKSFWPGAENSPMRRCWKNCAPCCKQHGRISGILIDETEGLPSSTAFSHRFGTLVNAYRLIGYDPGIDYSFIEENRRLRKRHPEIVASVVQKIMALGAHAVMERRNRIAGRERRNARVHRAVPAHRTPARVRRAG